MTTSRSSKAKTLIEISISASELETQLSRIQGVQSWIAEKVKAKIDPTAVENVRLLCERIGELGKLLRD